MTCEVKSDRTSRLVGSVNIKILGKLNILKESDDRAVLCCVNSILDRSVTELTYHYGVSDFLLITKYDSTVSAKLVRSIVAVKYECARAGLVNCSVINANYRCVTAPIVAVKVELTIIVCRYTYLTEIIAVCINCGVVYKYVTAELCLAAKEDCACATNRSTCNSNLVVLEYVTGYGIAIGETKVNSCCVAATDKLVVCKLVIGDIGCRTVCIVYNCCILCLVVFKLTSVNNELAVVRVNVVSIRNQHCAAVVKELRICDSCTTGGESKESLRYSMLGVLNCTFIDYNICIYGTKNCNILNTIEDYVLKGYGCAAHNVEHCVSAVSNEACRLSHLEAITIDGNSLIKVSSLINSNVIKECNSVAIYCCCKSISEGVVILDGFATGHGNCRNNIELVLNVVIVCSIGNEGLCISSHGVTGSSNIYKAGVRGNANGTTVCNSVTGEDNACRSTYANICISECVTCKDNSICILCIFIVRNTASPTGEGRVGDLNILICDTCACSLTKDDCSGVVCRTVTDEGTSINSKVSLSGDCAESTCEAGNSLTHIDCKVVYYCVSLKSECCHVVTTIIYSVSELDGVTVTVDSYGNSELSTGISCIPVVIYCYVCKNFDCAICCRSLECFLESSVIGYIALCIGYTCNLCLNISCAFSINCAICVKLSIIACQTSSNEIIVVLACAIIIDLIGICCNVDIEVVVAEICGSSFRIEVPVTDLLRRCNTLEDILGDYKLNCIGTFIIVSETLCTTCCSTGEGIAGNDELVSNAIVDSKLDYVGTECYIINNVVCKYSLTGCLCIYTGLRSAGSTVNNVISECEVVNSLSLAHIDMNGSVACGVVKVLEDTVSNSQILNTNLSGSPTGDDDTRVFEGNAVEGDALVYDGVTIRSHNGHILKDCTAFALNSNVLKSCRKLDGALGESTCKNGNGVTILSCLDCICKACCKAKDIAVCINICCNDLVKIIGTVKDNLTAANLNAINNKCYARGHIINIRKNVPLLSPVFVIICDTGKGDMPRNIYITVNDAADVVKSSSTHKVTVCIIDSDNEAFLCIAPNFTPDTCGRGVTVEVVSARSFNNAIAAICVLLTYETFCTEVRNVYCELAAANRSNVGSDRNRTVELTAGNSSGMRNASDRKCCVGTLVEDTACDYEILTIGCGSAVVPETAVDCTAGNGYVTAVSTKITITVSVNRYGSVVSDSTTVDSKVNVATPRIVIQCISAITCGSSVFNSTALDSQCTEVKNCGVNLRGSNLLITLIVEGKLTAANRVCNGKVTMVTDCQGIILRLGVTGNRDGLAIKVDSNLLVSIDTNEAVSSIVSAICGRHNDCLDIGKDYDNITTLCCINCRLKSLIVSLANLSYHLNEGNVALCVENCVKECTLKVLNSVCLNGACAINVSNRSSILTNLYLTCSYCRIDKSESCILVEAKLTCYVKNRVLKYGSALRISIGFTTTIL